MITRLKEPFNLTKTELYAATGIYVLVLFTMFFRVADSNVTVIWTQYRYMFNEYGLHYSYSKYYFFPMVARYSLYFGSFLLWNFVIVPSLIARRRTSLMITLAITLFGIIWLFCGITDTWLKGYLFYKHSAAWVYNLVFKTNFVYAIRVMMMLTLYTLIQQAAIYLLKNTDRIEKDYKVLTRDSILALVVWMLVVFGLLLVNINTDLTSLFSFTLLVAIGIYSLSVSNMIPATLANNNGFASYLRKVLLTTAVISLPGGFILAMILSRPEPVLIILGVSAAFQLFAVAPFSWITYKRRMAGTAELNTLKTALGTSTANLDFLRSQINPHFLFNALNTLYGTALQENADRTGEGIQRLGDMMRFMLQENMHEKILLTREIDYLNNYISLQKLRTQTSPDIVIDVQIEDHILGLQIAPMLLIPFIENAFKHGISLRERSHIKITLQTKENTLYFDVHNSIHTRADNDPEKGKSGIGLLNVKQRLKLLYNNKHELIVRENATEFFIHLTLQLA